MNNHQIQRTEQEIYLNEKQMDFFFDPEKKLWFYSKPEVERTKLITEGKVNTLTFLRKQRNKYWIGGRRTGKTFLKDFLIFTMFATMPRQLVTLASISYTQIENNLLPELKLGLRKKKIREGVHYVYGKKPPKHFIEPEYQVEDYKHVMTFINGFSIEMASDQRIISLDRGATRAGLIGDELSFLDPKWWHSVLIPTVSANPRHILAKNPLYNSIHGFSSPPTNTAGQWVWNMEEKAKSKPDKFFFIRSSTYDNVDVVGIEYIKNLEETLPVIQFNIEIKAEKRPTFTDGFYPSFNEKKHTYSSFGYKEKKNGELYETQFLDYDKDSSLIISFDFNASIKTAIVAQYDKEVKIINTFYLKWGLIADLVGEICRYYNDHNDRNIIVYGDRNGYDIDTNTGKCMYDYIKQTFWENDWHCRIEAIRADIPHKDKHNIINVALSNNLNVLPNILINKDTSNNLILSIENSRIKDDYQKNKDDEKNKNIPQETVTHFSDAFDYLVYTIYASLVLSSNTSSPGISIG